MLTSEAMAHLREAIQEDEDYAWTWHCNVAMAVFDQDVDLETSNKAAARFMQLAFDVDVTETVMWNHLKEIWKS